LKIRSHSKRGVHCAFQLDVDRLDWAFGQGGRRLLGRGITGLGPRAHDVIDFAALYGGQDGAQALLTGDLRKGDLPNVVCSVILEELAKVESEREMVARMLKAEPVSSSPPLDDDAIIARLHSVIGDLQKASDERDAVRARELIRSLIKDIGSVRITVTGSLTSTLGPRLAQSRGPA
jgi:hypothetical protein